MLIYTRGVYSVSAVYDIIAHHAFICCIVMTIDYRIIDIGRLLVLY